MSNHLRDEIIWIPLQKLKKWERNYNQGDIGAIHESILQFGFVGTLKVWQNNTVVAGNHALMALQSIKAAGLPAPVNIRENGNEWLVACSDCSYLTRVQAEAFAVADNRTKERSYNDREQLAKVLADIAAEDQALLLATGYDGSDIDALLKGLIVDEPLFGNPTPTGGEGGAEGDSVADDSEVTGEVSEMGTMLVIGAYRILLERETYLNWLENLKQEVGFDKDAVQSEIRRRLGL